MDSHIRMGDVIRDEEHDPCVVVEQKRPEIVDRANAAFPVRSFCLKLWQPLAEELRAPGTHLSKQHQLTALANTLATYPRRLHDRRAGLLDCGSVRPPRLA